MHKKPCNLFCYSNVASQSLTQSGKQQRKSIAVVFRFALVLRACLELASGFAYSSNNGKKQK
jgi:hypothetical protein